MSKNLGPRVACLVFAAAAVAVSFAPAAEATPITTNFTVNVTSGPLTGTVENGSFSYDSSIAVPSTSNLATGLLSALDFTFNGITYTAGTANTGWLNFDAVGHLNSFSFGPSCGAGWCSIAGGQNQWWVGPGVGGFAYSAPEFHDIGYGNVTYALASVHVPEPGTLGLFCLGLLLVGPASRWRWAVKRFE